MCHKPLHDLEAVEASRVVHGGKALRVLGVEGALGRLLGEPIQDLLDQAFLPISNCLRNANDEHTALPPDADRSLVFLARSNYTHATPLTCCRLIFTRKLLSKLLRGILRSAIAPF